jgi:hypothetical protein
MPRLNGHPGLPAANEVAGPRGLECIRGVVVALPLTIASSQFVIGSFEARFCARPRAVAPGNFRCQLNQRHSYRRGGELPAAEVRVIMTTLD